MRRCGQKLLNVAISEWKCSALSLPFLFMLLVQTAHAAAPLPPLFSVTLNGQPTRLHDFQEGSLAIFTVDGGVKVHVRTGFEVFEADVRPASAGAQPVIDPDHSGVMFTLRSATPVTVEFNRYTEHTLHLLAGAPETHPIVGPAPHVRYFGPGEHRAGVIELMSGETVYLADGAWVHGRIVSHNTHDITVSGRGVLDGTGVEAPDTPHGPQGMVYLDHTTNAHLEGVTVFNSGLWTIHIQGSQRVWVNGVRVLNASSRNGNDGIDVDSSSDVDLRNLFIRTGDDCIAIKNLLDVPVQHIRVSKAVLWNMPEGGNGVEVGYELRSHPIRDIVFDDIDMIHVEHGAALGIHNGDSASVEDVTFSNIRIEDVRRKLIDFEIFYTAWSKDHPAVDWSEMIRRMDRGGARDGRVVESADDVREHSAMRGSISNIFVRNVEITGGGMPYSVLSGFDSTHRISDVHICKVNYRKMPLASVEAMQLFIDYADPPDFEVSGEKTAQ